MFGVFPCHKVGLNRANVYKCFMLINCFNIFYASHNKPHPVMQIRLVPKRLFENLHAVFVRVAFTPGSIAF